MNYFDQSLILVFALFFMSGVRLLLEESFHRSEKFDYSDVGVKPNTGILVE